MVMNPMVSNPDQKIAINRHRRLQEESCEVLDQNPCDIPLYWLVNRDPYIRQITRVLVTAHVETHLFQNGGFVTCKMIFTNLSFLLAMVCQAAYPRVPANRGE